MTGQLPEHPGAALRRKREERGLSLRDLAAEVAFDWSYLAQVERGERFGSPLLAVLVDEALGADGELAAVFTEADEARRHTVRTDDDAVRRSENLAEQMRNAGVIPLPDDDTPADYGTAWERHDDPEEQP